MKLKKFFAGVLAAAMMLTVGATAAFADEVESTDKMIKPVNDQAMVTLTKNLTVESGTAPNSMKFDFTITPDDANEAKHIEAGVVNNGVAPSVTFTADTANGKSYSEHNEAYSEKFSFDLIKLLGNKAKQVGKYAYKIAEVEPNIPGITKDNKVIHMVVSVVNQNAENPNGTDFGYYVALYSDGETTKSDGVFNNTYKAQDLTVTKKVKGGLGDLNEKFDFEVTFNGTTGASYKGLVAGSLNDVVSVKETNSGKAVAAGDFLTYGTSYTVTMKHNGTMSFSNLPTDVTYTVKEVGSAVSGTDVVKDQYTVTVAGQNGTNAVAFDTGKETVSGSIADSAVTVNFTNEHKGQPDMGVVLDNAPYIAMLAIVAIGGVALMLNKRRRDEE